MLDVKANYIIELVQLNMQARCAGAPIEFVLHRICCRLADTSQLHLCNSHRPDRAPASPPLSLSHGDWISYRGQCCGVPRSRQACFMVKTTRGSRTMQRPRTTFGLWHVPSSDGYSYPLCAGYDWKPPGWAPHTPPLFKFGQPASKVANTESKIRTNGSIYWTLCTTASWRPRW